MKTACPLPNWARGQAFKNYTRYNALNVVWELKAKVMKTACLLPNWARGQALKNHTWCDFLKVVYELPIFGPEKTFIGWVDRCCHPLQGWCLSLPLHGALSKEHYLQGHTWMWGQKKWLSSQSRMPHLLVDPSHRDGVHKVSSLETMFVM